MECLVRRTLDVASREEALGEFPVFLFCVPFIIVDISKIWFSFILCLISVVAVHVRGRTRHRACTAF